MDKDIHRNYALAKISLFLVSLILVYIFVRDFIGISEQTGYIKEKRIFTNSKFFMDPIDETVGTYNKSNVTSEKKKENNYAFMVNGNLRIVHKNDFESYEVGDKITYKIKPFTFQGVNTTILSKSLTDSKK